MDDPYARQPWLASYPPGLPLGLDVPAVPLPRLLDDAADRHATRTALAFLGARTTYADLRDQVDRCATALAGLGTGRGDRVALVLPNCPQAVVAWLAVLRLGAVVVAFDPSGDAAELRRRLADSGATVALCHDRAYPALAAGRGGTALRHVVVTALADVLPRRSWLSLRPRGGRTGQGRAEPPAPVPEGDRVRRYADLLRSRPAPPQVGLDPEREVAVLQYTAGTTGPSRGAMLTHHALVANAQQVRTWLVPTPAGEEVVLAGLPLWHPAGATLCLTTCLLLGGTLVLVPALDGEDVRRAVTEHRPTLLPVTPGLLGELLDGHVDLTSVRLAVVAGSGPAPDLRDRFAAGGGGRLLHVYGAAEAPLTHVAPADGSRGPGTLGLPLPGTRAKVVDPGDPTRLVPVGSPGELAVTGPQVSVGYWRNPRDTRGAVTPGGHHLTGDLVVMDAAGVFTSVGRKGTGAVTGVGAGPGADPSARVPAAAPGSSRARVAPVRQPRSRPAAAPPAVTRPTTGSPSASTRAAQAPSAVPQPTAAARPRPAGRQAREPGEAGTRESRQRPTPRWTPRPTAAAQRPTPRPTPRPAPRPAPAAERGSRAQPATGAQSGPPSPAAPRPASGGGQVPRASRREEEPPPTPRRSAAGPEPADRPRAGSAARTTGPAAARTGARRVPARASRGGAATGSAATTPGTGPQDAGGATLPAARPRPPVSDDGARGVRS